MPAVITDIGLQLFARRTNSEWDIPLYIGWGTGAGTAVSGNTTLFTEASEPRATGVVQLLSVGVAFDSYQVNGVLTANGSKTITNWGLFDASTGGHLLAIESIDPGQALTIGQMMTFIFRFQFLRG